MVSTCVILFECRAQEICTVRTGRSGGFEHGLYRFLQAQEISCCIKVVTEPADTAAAQDLFDSIAVGHAWEHWDACGASIAIDTAVMDMAKDLTRNFGNIEKASNQLEAKLAASEASLRTVEAQLKEANVKFEAAEAKRETAEATTAALAERVAAMERQQGDLLARAAAAPNAANAGLGSQSGQLAPQAAAASTAEREPSGGAVMEMQQMRQELQRMQMQMQQQMQQMQMQPQQHMGMQHMHHVQPVQQQQVMGTMPMMQQQQQQQQPMMTQQPGQFPMYYNR